MIPDWQAAVLVVLVVIPIVTAVATRILRPHALDRLPPLHVAAATIIAFVGWQSVIQIPGALAAFDLVGAGVSGFFLSNQQIVILAGFVFVLVSFVAAFGILIRRRWGVAMGVAVGVDGVGTAILGVVSSISTLNDAGFPGDQLVWLVPQIALGGVPPLLAIILLVWPHEGSYRTRPRSGSPADAPPQEGITDLDPDHGLDDWPDAVIPAEPGR